MIQLTDRQRKIAGWVVSVLFNAGLLVIGAIWLIQPARFQVEAAKSSTEIDLADEPPPPASPLVAPPSPDIPPPPPVSAPVTPAPPIEPSPLPPDLPAAVPTPTKTAPPPIVPQPIVTPPSPPLPPAKESPAKLPSSHPSTTTKTASMKDTSHASKGATDAHPDELHNEPPEYPEESRLAHEQGIVVLRVEVTAGGEASSVNIRQSSGYTRLDQAALKAVRHWRFHAATAAGISVSSEVDVPVCFKLE